MAKITLDQLSKSYGSTEVLHHINGDIDDGSLVVIVGPSGCGKSTLLRMIAGLEDINSGEISLGGKVINQLAPRDRDVSMVFQNYALYPHLSVAKNIGFSLRMRKVEKSIIEKKVTEAAEMLGLTHLLSRLPRNLSGGERQRVAIARALINQPKILLADEPTGNLDDATGEEIYQLLATLKAEHGFAAVVVTHDLRLAQKLDTQYRLIKGQLSAGLA